MIIAALLSRFRVYIIGAVLIAVAVSGTYALAYMRGAASARAECDAERIRAELAIAQADLALARRAAEDAARLNQEADAARAEAEQEALRYAQDLASRPDSGVCRLDRRDVDRLLRIGPTHGKP